MHSSAFLFQCVRNETVLFLAQSNETKVESIEITLDDADTLIVTELSRLGRSTGEVIGLVNELIKKQVRVIVIKQNLDRR
ncbi:protein of unknown function [resolvase domain] [Legionella fallonii LLAP-10]|uniref:Resolvase/invertase-type recombinase catalytic domain-containing protein n=1 Tax=Legionella fallonii LLAP-10 TaxID=1212491 RepID=A0A098G6E5_9GAMM|nr:protein of unknown function [resolvase domain] [Legionella fallonii LLAP-10]